jgi:hypothetical protein
MALLPGVPCPVITEADCVDAYKRASGATSAPGPGLVTEKFLTWLVKNGLGGQKPVMWAAVSDTWDKLEDADYEFVAGIYGVEIDTAQSYGHWTWDNVPKSSTNVFDGYHEVCGGAYDANYVKCATWAKVASMTRAYVGAKLNEHHVIVWQHIWDRLSYERQVDLAAKFLAATGRTVQITATPTTTYERTSMSTVYITPVRVLDTRTTKTPMKAGENRKVLVAGAHGIPAEAIGVSGNLTVANATANGFLAATPETFVGPSSTANYMIGAAADPNGFNCGLAADGTLNLYASAGTVQVILDITSYDLP